MSVADLDTNRQVRKVFVKHWLDLGRLSIRSSKGKVWIRGSLTRISGVRGELTTPIVDVVFSDIKRIKAVRTLTIELDNWANDDGRWVPVTKSEAVAAFHRTSPTHDLDAAVREMETNEEQEQQEEDET